MSIKCSNKNCGYVNADGNSYCVNCGELLPEMCDRVIVRRFDYKFLESTVKSQREELDDIKKRGFAPIGYEIVSEAALDAMAEEREQMASNVSKLEKDLEELKKTGFAPSGFHLERDKSLWALALEREKTEKLRKYDDLVHRANQTWSQKLWQDIKNWWKKTGEGWFFALMFVLFWVILVIVGILIVFGIHNIVGNLLGVAEGWSMLISIAIVYVLALLSWKWVKDPDDGWLQVTIPATIVLCGLVAWVYVTDFHTKETKMWAKAEQRDGLWGLVNNKGKTVLPFEYDSIVTDRYDTIYARVYQKGNVGLVKTSTGKEIVPCKYQDIGGRYHCSLRGKLIAVRKDDGKMMFVDYNGEPKGAQDFDYARWWADAECGDVGQRFGGMMKYGFVDEQGALIIDCQYVSTHSFSEGLAPVKRSVSDPWICIDKDGKERYKLKYTTCDVYGDSLMAVTNSREWTANSWFGFVDRTGELRIGMHFTPWRDTDGSFYCPRFYNGKARVCYNGQNGWIDKSVRFTPQKE